MHENKCTLSLTDLATIFHVTKYPLRYRLKKNGLDERLAKSGHMVRRGKNKKRYYFDDYALTKIALTFKGKISNRKSVTPKPAVSNNQAKDISKKLSNINKKLDLIVNHLHITY